MKNYLMQMNVQSTANSAGTATTNTMKNKKSGFEQILQDSLNNSQKTERKETAFNKSTALLQNKKNQFLSDNTLKPQQNMTFNAEEATLKESESEKSGENAAALLALLQNLSALLQTNEEINPEQPMDFSTIEAIQKTMEEVAALPFAVENPAEEIVAEINLQLSALLDETPVSKVQEDVAFAQDQEAAVPMDAEKLLAQLQTIVDKFSGEQQEANGIVEAPVTAKKEVGSQTVPQIEAENMNDVEAVEENIVSISEKTAANPKEPVETKKDEKVKSNHQNAVQKEDFNVTKTTEQQKDFNMFIGSSTEKAEINLGDPVSAPQPGNIKPTFTSVMDQILPKAEMFIDEERSEMLIQLKPDNLGKLVMKLEVEKGIVVAKFVAESHMVKEILESNMNTLKDSLQQKGLNVQELSVFVGNDGNFQGHQNFMSFQKRQLHSRIKGLGGTPESVAIQAEAQTVKSLHSENIDFLA